MRKHNINQRSKMVSFSLGCIPTHLAGVFVFQSTLVAAVMRAFPGSKKSTRANVPSGATSVRSPPSYVFKTLEPYEKVKRRSLI